MILTCPSCRTRYVVPDSAVGISGRKVRCAQCRFSWFQEGPDTPPAAAPAPPRPPAVSRPAPLPPEPVAEVVGEGPAEVDWAPEEPAYEEEPPRRHRRNPARLWTAIAVVSALLMVGALAAIYFIGPQKIAVWMGAEVATEDPLRFTRQEVAKEPLPTSNELVTVTGEITNVTDAVQRVPQIRAEVTDADQRVIFVWMIAPPVSELQPRQAVTFSSASTDVPKGGRNLNLSFGGTG